MMAEAAPHPTRTAIIGSAILREYGIYIALAALIAYFSVRIPEFRTWDNAL